MENRNTSISHDIALIAELGEDPEYAAEYLKAVLEDAEVSGVVSIARRQLAEAGYGDSAIIPG